MTGVQILPTIFGTARFALEMAFGADLSADPATWTWTDVTGELLEGSPVSMTVGRPDERSQTPPATLEATFDNDSGDWTTHNPAGAHWPHLKRRNTPVRVRASLDNGSTWTVRFQGGLVGVNPDSDQSANVATAKLTAAGKLRQLKQGKNLLRSALTRTALSAATINAGSVTPIAVWPLEDGVDSNQAASALPGGTPMVTNTGLMDFNTDDAPVGGAGSAKPSTDAVNQLSGPIVGGSTTAWQMSIWVKATFDADPGGWCPLEVITSTGKIVQFIIDRAGDFWSLSVDIVDHEGDTDAAFFTQWGSLPGINTNPDTGWHLMQAVFVQSGPNVSVGIAVDGTDTTVTDTWTSETIGAPVAARAIGAPQPGVITDGVSEVDIAGIAIHNGSSLVELYQAGTGWVGETPRARLDRLAGEQGLQLDHAPDGTYTTDATMGPQKVDTFLNLLLQCEAVDAGFLYDGLGPGLAYQGISQRYNQTAALTVDVSAGELAASPRPVDDDQRTLNKMVVSRTNGSSATAEQTDGPLGTDPNTGAGVYDSSLELNAEDDTRLGFRAGWEVHTGTVEGFRYPSISLDLAASPGLAAAWLGVLPGNLIDLTNLASVDDRMPAGDIPLIVEGWAETIATHGWTATPNCTPAQVYDVFKIEASGSEKHLGALQTDSGGTRVTFPVSAGATSLSITTDPGLNVFTQAAGDLPLDVEISGIKVHVTNITGASSPQTFTVSPLTKALLGGAVVKLWHPGVIKY